MATATTLHIEIRQSPADHRVSILRGHSSRWFSRYSSRRQPMKKIARCDCAAALLLLFGAAWLSPHALAQSTPTRYEQTDPSVTYTAGWAQDSSRSWSAGTAAVSTTPGAQAMFTFSGPSVNWIGGRGPWSGIARVSVDGAFVAEVDTYSRTEEIRVTMFTVNGLTNASHTLTIEVTGQMNAQAMSNYVVVDAFDVPGPAVSRLQETDPDVAYTAGWVQDNTLNSFYAGCAGYLHLHRDGGHLDRRSRNPGRDR